MQTSSSKRTIGCIGKCTSDLRPEEIDYYTDNIHKTLNQEGVREIFKRYLQECGLTDNLECLELYETCDNILEASRWKSKSDPCLEQLIKNAAMVKKMAEDLDGVSQIDKDFLRSFKEALNSNSRAEVLGILVDTKDRCRNHLRHIHDNFKAYVSEPCPLSK